MSGYLDVKHPLKSIGIIPFKQSWRKQWCILRPSPTRLLGGSLVVYCHEAGTAAGSVELLPGCLVRRTKSTSRPFAFAVFPQDQPLKPFILLAAPNIHETYLWMNKINKLLHGNMILGTEGLLIDTFPVRVVGSRLSEACGAEAAGAALCISSAGLCLEPNILIPWQHINSVSLCTHAVDRSQICIIHVGSDYCKGGGEIKLLSSMASELVTALKRCLEDRKMGGPQTSDAEPTSCCHQPSIISSDNMDISQELNSHLLAAEPILHNSLLHCPSVSSIASGIYEEIAEVPARASAAHDEEPAYEIVGECGGPLPPPPLPPRQAHSLWNASTKMSYEEEGSWQEGLPRCGSVGADCRTLPKAEKPRHAFNVFRKRLKSDSRIMPKPDAKQPKDSDTKKKRFDFVSSRDLFRNFRVGRKNKNLKISKSEAKSCEFLDESEPVAVVGRCSKSVESLERDDTEDFLDQMESHYSSELDLEHVGTTGMPPHIVKLLFPNRDKTRVQVTPLGESDYMPMSPIAPPPPVDYSYMVMSPRPMLEEKGPHTT